MRKRLRSLLVALASTLPLWLLCTASAEPTPSPALLILAKRDKMLSIVDPQSLKVVARISVGENPHEVIASSDGRHAWVSNYGNGSQNTITVVDLIAQKVEKVIPLGPIYGPHGLAFAGGKTFFTAEREKLIGRIDPATETVEWLQGTGQIGTHMLWVSRDTHRIVTVNVGSGTMSLFEQMPIASGPIKELSKNGGQTTRGTGGPPAPDWSVSIVKVGTKPEGFDVLADANGNPKTIWVANAGEGTISVIDFASHKLIDTIAAGVVTANRLKFSPDGKLALVSREKSPEITVLDVASHRVIQRIPVGTGAAGVLLPPGETRAFVSCSPDNENIVIDLKSMKIVGKIQAGQEPDGMAWAVRH